jgi:formylglycine-generating enzyme required for sulfatase activity
MVSVGGRFCVDRFEAMIVDKRTGETLSPDFPATPNLLDFAFGEWATARERTGDVHARAFPLPFLPISRLGQKTEPLAVSRLGVRPNGYVTGLTAETACAAAGKRLCLLTEFVTACRGEDDTAFPYGDSYEEGACNVYRDEHPAAILHDNASIGHLDPRLNRVSPRGKPLYQSTGQSLACRSRFGADAAYDMAGNIDEWVDEGNGAFAGGFYSRSTRAGCDALITAHPRTYLDYSTGVRCCKDAASAKW